MAITIIECTRDLITLSNFTKKGTILAIESELRKPLGEIQDLSNDWINEASQMISELVVDSAVIFPVTIILPGFALLTKIIKVPRVETKRQAEIIKTHVDNLFGTSNEVHLAYYIIALGELELEVVCVLVKKNWIESFCKAMELVQIEVMSIEPPAIHYYNAYKEQAVNDNIVRLLLVIQNLSACYLFLDKQIRCIYQITIKDISLVDETKGLIDLFEKKYPGKNVQEILVLGQNMDNKDFVDSLEKCIAVQTRQFLPFKSGYLYSIGSVGAAYRKLYGRGMSMDLTPAEVRKIWDFNRSKKAILIAGGLIVGALFIFFNSVSKRGVYYEEMVKAYEEKILPMNELVLDIARNEKLISFYNEGLRALELYIQSNKSWVHFLNSLQNSLVEVSGVRIHSLKVIEVEPKAQYCWKDELMGVQDKSVFANTLVMQISGSFAMEGGQQVDETIDKVRLLMSKLEKIDFIEEAKNLHFDTQKLPIVPFSISLELKAGRL